jgi:hypothetical protein
VPAPSSSTVSMIWVTVETWSPALEVSATSRPAICSTSTAGSRVTSGASAARNTSTSITRMTRLDSSWVRRSALAWEVWLSTALGSEPVKWTVRVDGRCASAAVERIASTTGSAWELEGCTSTTSSALTALPSADGPWSVTETTWSSLASRPSSEVTADCSLEVSFGELVVTTMVASESLAGRNGAASCVARALGWSDGRKELLSVLTTLERVGSSSAVAIPRATQAAITRYRKRMAERARAAMKFSTAAPFSCGCGGVDRAGNWGRMVSRSLPGVDVLRGLETTLEWLERDEVAADRATGAAA